MVVKCPKGHWFDADAPGRSGRCPQCATQTQTETSVSDDDVLAIMSEPEETPTPKPPAEEPAKVPVSSGSGIMRRKKICPDVRTRRLSRLSIVPAAAHAEAGLSGVAKVVIVARN